MYLSEPMAVSSGLMVSMISVKAELVMINVVSESLSKVVNAFSLNSGERGTTTAPILATAQ